MTDHDMIGFSDLLNDAAEDAAQDAAEQFTQYLIDESDVTVVVDALDMGALETVRNELRGMGYRVGDGRDDIPAYGFATPRSFAALADDYQRVARINDRSEANTTSIGYRGITVRQDTSMPEGYAIVVVQDALTPTNPFDHAPMGRFDATDAYEVSIKRPYVVRDPNGVVVVEVQDDE